MSSLDSTDANAAGVRAGDVLAGKYWVDRVLGVGGMGVVVAAHHMQLDDKVAIKFLLPQAVQDPETVARFDREARAAVRIRSEHVARVIDVGNLETGAPYMVMEYLEGVDLAGWLAQNGKLPIAQAVDFVLQASEAIAEAHAIGIVHRDLKPANLFCIRRPDGAFSIKVLDFGISKVVAGNTQGAMAMTRTQSVMGSPLYMPPEQLESSKNVDPRSDIWSLGVILYELIAGEVPFQDGALTELILKIVSAQPPPITLAFRSDVPPGLERVILRCLEKNRGLRYANMAELAAALVEFAPASSKLSVDNTFTNIAESAAADTAAGGGAGATGYAVLVGMVHQAQQNVIHDNDNGVEVGVLITPQFDFSADGLQANANEIYCNSKLPSTGGNGYDVLLSYSGSGGFPANFSGNIWDHVPPTSAASLTTGANGTDVVTAPSADMPQVTGAIQNTSSACASGRVQ